MIKLKRRKIYIASSGSHICHYLLQSDPKLYSTGDDW